MEHLKAALSDKEYQVITECALTNMGESPNLPAPVVEQKTEDAQKGKVKENEPVNEGEHSEELPGSRGTSDAVWTTVKVAVGIQLVELGLYTGGTRDAALASVQVSPSCCSLLQVVLQECCMELYVTYQYAYMHMLLYAKYDGFS